MGDAMKNITSGIERNVRVLREQLQKAADQPKGPGEGTGPLFRMGTAIAELELLAAELAALNVVHVRGKGSSMTQRERNWLRSAETAWS